MKENLRRDADAVKKPFDIKVVIRRLRKAVKLLPKAAMFQLAEEGYTSVFQQLVACLISIRTYDETMLRVARQLFERTRTAEEMTQLSPKEIDALIRSSTFHEAKARQIHGIARRTVDELGGELPCDPEVLMSL